MRNWLHSSLLGPLALLAFVGVLSAQTIGPPTGGGTPSGAAGGGLTGTYPNPTVASVPATAMPVAVFQNAIGGLVLSNDGTTPNSVLDIAAGSAADSTNVSLFSIGAFTKSTAGAWASGSGSNGMGNGLTIAASTWYHVCLTPNGGTSDVWFDTSTTCTNKPSGVSGSLFRIVGHFLTDGSAHIVTFVQNGRVPRTTNWQTPTLDANGTTANATPANATLTIPLGFSVRPIINIQIGGSGAIGRVRVYTPLVGDNNQANNANVGVDATAVTGIASWGQVANEYSDTGKHIRFVETSADAGVTIFITTVGYIDDLGT